MEIEIKDFGPIDYVKFDLNKDIHLVYGKNAIGKSYSTYCIYCLLKNIKDKTVRSRFFYLDVSQEHPFKEFIRNKIKKLKSDKSIDCTKDFFLLVEKELKDIILNGLQNSLLNTFSSLKNLKNRYSNKNYEIVIHVSSHEKLIIFSNDEGILNLKYENDKLKKIEIVQKNTKSTKFAFFINQKVEFGCPTEEEFTSGFIKHMVVLLNNFLRNLDFNIRDIYYLPASRSGLYQALNAFTPIIAELTKSRFFMQSKSIQLPSLSEPLADYFIDLSTMDKEHVNTKYEEIIALMQNDILQGEVEYNDETKRIHYKPHGIDLELNLSEASSMVAELSPLVLYFKHILNHKYGVDRGFGFFVHNNFVEPFGQEQTGHDILFIEEPEAHLHPEVQVKLMEIFAKLSALNLKIVITSHSNYMFNKLNNLVIKKELDFRKVAVYHLVRSENGSTVNKEMDVTDRKSVV